MKIVHISASAPYNDNWGYQDNLLPKYQRKIGHEVAIITTNTAHKDGKIVKVPCGEYELDDGVMVVRLEQKQYHSRVVTGLRARLNVFTKLVEMQPDFIFFHGLVSATIEDVIKYKKNVNPNCIIVQDNHLDYNIGLKYSTIKGKIVRAYHRYENRKTIGFVEKVYGVTPWRKKYAEEYFGIPKEKTDVLIMGADDEKINFLEREDIRNRIREKYNISPGDFLVVTGGKIDAKKKIDQLMEACANIKNVKLLVFGNVAEEIKERFNSLVDNEKIIFIGWINSDDVYQYFFAADLVFFPGQHSVLWEQACASKVPCVFERWDGMDHVNNGGNSDFVDNVNIETLSKKIEELLYTEKYFLMKSVSESDATDIYLYSKIAQKSLECVDQC